MFSITSNLTEISLKLPRGLGRRCGACTGGGLNLRRARFAALRWVSEGWGGVGDCLLVD